MKDWQELAASDRIHAPTDRTQICSPLVFCFEQTGSDSPLYIKRVAGGRREAKAMPLYFFSVSDGERTTLDSDGIELPDMCSVRIEATKSTGDMLRDLNHGIRAGTELRMDVADEARKPVFSLRVIAEAHE
jgi:hypothetical protein